MIRATLFRAMLILIVGWLLFPGLGLGAGGNDLSSSAFVADSFEHKPPKPALLWITPALKPAIHEILGHDLNRLRLRYWRQGSRSVWILEEIGKEQAITFGVVVADGRIEQLRVLVFRESRGWEIRHPFFTDQFNGATLNGGQKLDRHIDNISGATLSVRAATRITRLALFLHQQVLHQQASQKSKGGRP